MFNKRSIFKSSLIHNIVTKTVELGTTVQVGGNWAREVILKS